MNLEGKRVLVVPERAESLLQGFYWRLERRLSFLTQMRRRTYRPCQGFSRTERISGFGWEHSRRRRRRTCPLW